MSSGTKRGLDLIEKVNEINRFVLAHLLKVMHMLAEGTFGVHIVVDVYAAAVGDFGELGLNIVDEGTKFADVDTAAFLELVVQVGDEGAPDNEHLGHRINR